MRIRTLAAVAAFAVLTASCMAGTRPSVEAVNDDNWVYRGGTGVIQGVLSPIPVVVGIIDEVTDGGVTGDWIMYEPAAGSDVPYQTGFYLGCAGGLPGVLWFLGALFGAVTRRKEH